MGNRFYHPAVDALRDLSDVPGDLPRGLLNLPVIDGETPLTHAVAARDMDFMLRLLKAGAKPNVPNLQGTPPIIMAALLGEAPLIRVMIKFGADPDATDASGRTAAHFGFFLGLWGVVDRLAQHGADFTRRDVDGRGILDFACAARDGKDVAGFVRRARELLPTLDDDAVPAYRSLRSDADFRRLDRLPRPTAEGGIDFDRVSRRRIWLVTGAPVVAGFLLQSVWAAALAFYLAMLLSLIPRLLVSGRAARGTGQEADPAAVVTEPGVPVRALAHVLKQSSRTLQHDLARMAPPPPDNARREAALWGLALACPLAATAAVAAIAAGLLLLTTRLEGAPDWLWAVVAILGVTLLISLPRAVIGHTDNLFARFARRILVDKIEARQSAMSAEINAQRDLLQGGRFAKGGVLYLRSFQFDGTFVIGGLDFEILLLNLFHQHAAVFALNAEENSRGAINLKTSDETWKDLVHRMIRDAGQILMIPATSQGVQEEIAILQSGGWFSKTLFIAPPASESRQTARDWERMRRLPALRGLEVPPYSSAGFLFRLADNGMLIGHSPLGIDLFPLPLPPGLEAETDANRNADDGEDFEDSPETEEGAESDGSSTSSEPGGGQGSAPGAGAGAASAAASAGAAATAAASMAAVSVAMHALPPLDAADMAGLSGGGDGSADYGGDGFDGGGFDGGGGGD